MWSPNPMEVVRGEGKGKREGRREKESTVKTGLRTQPEGNTSEL